MKNQLLFSLLATSFVCLPLRAEPKIDISHKVPFNLFAADDPVRMSAALRGVPAGGAAVRVAVTNYFGEEVWRRDFPVTAASGQKATVALDIGKLEPGYYELVCRSGGRTETCSLGVADLTARSADEAIAGGYRFGLKVFQVGSPGVWWRRPLQWNLAEAADASVALGLNWTRHGFNQNPSAEEPGIIGTVELTTNHNMNVVYKIEGIPEQAYDAAHYGPIADYGAKKNKKGWSRTTVPLKDPYQSWLREQIGKLPANQNVFEIGNEVWDYMSAEEFAEWCRLVVPVVKAMRPNAVIGADPGNIAWAKRFIRAGGMEGMNAYYIHPYSFTPMPEHRVRAWLRNRSDFLAKQLGRRLDIYVTEYGWPTAPQDKRQKSVDERTQAQRTTRQSLMLYAEDCKTLIPHWMGDREQDPTDWNHWFGFFRLNGQPKPVVIAHSVCARMIDGSRFLGDLDLGPGVGAMLFDRKGTRVLALWTLDETPGTGRDVAVDVGATEARVVDMMGRRRNLRTNSGVLTLRVSSEVLYVEGVDGKLASAVVPPEGELNTETWTKRGEGVGAVWPSKGNHVADGILEEWSGVEPILLKPMGGNEATGVKAQAALAYNDTHLHVSVAVSGVPDGEKSSFELHLGTRPSRQLSLGGWGLYDYTLTLSPASVPGVTGLRLTNCTWEEPLLNPGPDSPSGVLWTAAPAGDGWTAEVSIPRQLLVGFPEAPGPKQLSGILRCRVGKTLLAHSTADVDNTLEWPYLELRE